MLWAALPLAHRGARPLHPSGLWLACYARVRMSNDTKWIIGTVVVLAGLTSAQIAGVNARIDDLRSELNARMDRIETRMDRIETRMDRIETRMDRIDERLRNVEIAFAKVDQRLLTIERVVLPGAEQPDQ